MEIFYYKKLLIKVELGSMAFEAIPLCSSRSDGMIKSSDGAPEMVAGDPLQKFFERGASVSWLTRDLTRSYLK